jgi:hypothetical protein
MTFAPLGQLFEDQAIQQIERRMADLQLKGRVQYKDVFNRTHHSTFGGTYHPMASGFVLSDNRADLDDPPPTHADK